MFFHKFMKVFEQLSDQQLLRRAVLYEVNFSDKLPASRNIANSRMPCL
jgi:hypothetical protein